MSYTLASLERVRSSKRPPSQQLCIGSTRPEIEGTRGCLKVKTGPAEGKGIGRGDNSLSGVRGNVAACKDTTACRVP